MKTTFIKKTLAAAPLAAALALVASPASAVDLTFCDAAGNPYCDGVSLDFDLGNYVASGTNTGCIAGNAFGSIVATIYGGVNLAATVSYDGDYAGLAQTEITLAPPFQWRHVTPGGVVASSGVMCFGAPVLNATSGASSLGR